MLLLPAGSTVTFVQNVIIFSSLNLISSMSYSVTNATRVPDCADEPVTSSNGLPVMVAVQDRVFFLHNKTIIMQTYRSGMPSVCHDGAHEHKEHHRTHWGSLQMPSLSPAWRLLVWPEQCLNRSFLVQQVVTPPCTI